MRWAYRGDGAVDPFRQQCLALSRLTPTAEKLFSAPLQSDGVTVAQEILVFLVQVRILVGLQVFKQKGSDFRMAV